MISYERNEFFISIKEQKKIKKLKILFAGCGLGSYIATSLARLGVSNFTIADGDTVSNSNLNRQYFETSDIGKNKAEVLNNKIKNINPLAKVQVLPKFLNEKDLKNLISSHDIVINAIDFDNKAFMVCNNYCQKYNKIEIFSLNLGFGAATMLFNSKTVTLFDFFKEKNPGRLKIKLIDFIISKNSNDYFFNKLQAYKNNPPENDPQIITGVLLNSAIITALVYKIIKKDKNIKWFPEVESLFLV